MRRTRNQANGSTYKSKGSWYLQYRLYDAQGKATKHTKWLGPAPLDNDGRASLMPTESITKKEAQRIAREEHLDKLDFRNTHPSSSMTLKAFWETRFYPDHVVNLSASGRDSYAYLFRNHVEPGIGQMKLCDVSFVKIQSLLNAKAKSQAHKPSCSKADGCECPFYSPETLRHIQRLISVIITHAKRCQMFVGDLPTEGIKLPKSAKLEKHPLTWGQVLELSDQMGAEEHLRENIDRLLTVELRNEVMGILVRLLCRTGLRISEMMGLKWQYVNLSEEPIQLNGGWLAPHTIGVRWGFVRRKWTSLKTSSSRRDVPLDTEAYKDMCRMRDIMHTIDCLTVDKPVFCSESGTPMDAHNIARRFLKSAAERVGVPAVSWHTMRHTWASLADGAGMSVAERQKILGHAAGSMTLHYTHADLGQARKGMELIGQTADTKQKRIDALRAELAALEGQKVLKAGSGE